MPNTVKDVQYLDAEDTEASPSTISDPGTGAYPIVDYSRAGLVYRSSSTNRTIIPWHRVIKVVETDVP